MHDTNTNTPNPGALANPLQRRANASTDRLAQVLFRTVTLEEWHREGVELFGEDQTKWRFVCPACGHVQSPEDFEPYKVRGANVHSAYMNCIGRYLPGRSEAFEEGPGPCNYTGGGLFDLRPVIVDIGTARPGRAFEFYREEA